MIDLCAGGIFAAMFGDDSEIVSQAIRTFSWHNNVFCSYSAHRQNYWRDKYVSMLKELTGFESVALFSTGSEATEAFWRVARVFTGKPGIWGGLIDPDEVGKDKPEPIYDSMHGVTLGALIMAGKFQGPETNYWMPLAERRLHMDGIMTAGMIIEPYHGPSAQFHKIEPTINRIVTHRKTWSEMLFCIDEIQGGFGRTGKLWAHEHYQENGKMLLNPDFITIGKLCGGGLPLSALLGPKEIMESDIVKEQGHLHSTHSGNPLMCAVGCTVIEEMQKQNLIQRSADLGEKLHEALKTFPIRTHGKGLLAGFEMKDNEEVKRVTIECLNRGVQVSDTGRKWIKIGPALNIPEEDLIQGISILKEVIGEVIDGRKTESDTEVSSPETPIDRISGSEGGETGEGN